MASLSTTRAREGYRTEQVIEHIFADDDSENEIESETETEESEEEEETSDENDKDIQVSAAENPPVRGRSVIRRGVQTRGGNRMLFYLKLLPHLFFLIFSLIMTFLIYWHCKPTCILLNTGESMQYYKDILEHQIEKM